MPIKWRVYIMTEPTYAEELRAIGTALEALAKLPPEQQRFALRMISERLGATQAAPLNKNGEGSQSGGNGITDNSDISQMPPKAFLVLKKPKTDVERIACLAYYLTKVRQVEHFKTLDLTRLNIEAAGEKFSNAANSVNNAVFQSRYLAQAGGGKKQIAPLGEVLVENLPDREAVTKALADCQRRPKRRVRAKKNAK